MNDDTRSHKELAGKVAIVTGAGRMRGIGHASAIVLAEMGADVVITGTGRDPSTFPEDEKAAGWRDIESVAEEVRRAGSRALPLVADVSDSEQVRLMIDRTVEVLGRVDIIVNNAAAPYGADRVPVLEVDEDVFKRVIDVKVGGTFLCSKMAADRMVEQGEGGRIINLSSSAGKRGQANMAAYNAANFAVDGFTQALAKELARHQITANCVCPGLTETARMDPLGRGEFWRQRAESIPMGRVGTDREVAELIGFLASPRAAYITGQAINVNGGAVTER
jgi:3-oxoacyl-[acyl-carrier protein] reductase/meso-butanediol dehydrogenase/(S,S)-butanediol dehydrogenase/diacetyl reductase